MKRVLVVLLTAVMVMGLAACGKQAETTQTTTTTQQNGSELKGDSNNDIIMQDQTTGTTTVTGSTTKGTTKTSAALPPTISPKKNIKMDAEYVAATYESAGETSVAAVGLLIQDSGPDGLICVRIDAMFESDPMRFEDGFPNRTPLQYNGKTYYRIGGGQFPYHVELTDKEIVVKQSFYEEETAITAKLVMLSNGDLQVTASYDDWFTVGQVLSIKNNYLN